MKWSAFGKVPVTETGDVMADDDADALRIIQADDDGAITMVNTDPTVGSSTTLILAANASRKYAMFINDADEAIYIELGGDGVMSEGIRLNKEGGSYEMSRKIGNLDVRVVNGICSSGSKNLLVIEGV